MSLVRFRLTHSPDCDIGRESDKPNGEEHQRTHRTTATLLRPATVGNIDLVHRGARDGGGVVQGGGY